MRSNTRPGFAAGMGSVYGCNCDPAARLVSRVCVLT